jgi:hypothetical protein
MGTMAAATALLLALLLTSSPFSLLTAQPFSAKDEDEKYTRKDPWIEVLIWPNVAALINSIGVCLLAVN